MRSRNQNFPARLNARPRSVAAGSSRQRPQARMGSPETPRPMAAGTKRPAWAGSGTTARFSQTRSPSTARDAQLAVARGGGKARGLSHAQRTRARERRPGPAAQLLAEIEHRDTERQDRHAGPDAPGTCVPLPRRRVHAVHARDPGERAHRDSSRIPASSPASVIGNIRPPKMLGDHPHRLRIAPAGSRQRVDPDRAAARRRAGAAARSRRSRRSSARWRRRAAAIS